MSNENEGKTFGQALFGDDWKPETIQADIEKQEYVENKISESQLINEKQQGVAIIDINQLVSFHKHPFQLYVGDRLNDMVDSIKNMGIITPIIVQSFHDNQYQILSGHNRVNAARLAGLTEIPAVIKEGLTEEEATLIVTETNLIQRSFSDLTHSERAAVIYTRHQAMKKQGARIDIINEITDELEVFRTGENLTSYQVDTKLDSKEKLGNEYNLSRATIARYLRIYKLENIVKQKLDSNQIPFTACIDISYLLGDEQITIISISDEIGIKIDTKKAKTLREFSERRTLNEKRIRDILEGKGKRVRKPTATKIQIKPTVLKRYFTSNDTKESIESTIEEALKLYFQHKKESIKTV